MHAPAGTFADSWLHANSPGTHVCLCTWIWPWSCHWPASLYSQLASAEVPLHVPSTNSCHQPPLLYVCPLLDSAAKQVHADSPGLCCSSCAHSWPQPLSLDPSPHCWTWRCCWGPQESLQPPKTPCSTCCQGWHRCWCEHQLPKLTRHTPQPLDMALHLACHITDPGPQHTPACPHPQMKIFLTEVSP